MELHQHDALQIMTPCRSWKAPWNPAQAAGALRDTNLYEAGGNIWWLNPFPVDDTAAITAGDKPACRQVGDIQQLHFHPSAALPGRPLQHMFPAPMVVHLQQRDRLSGEPERPDWPHTSMLGSSSCIMPCGYAGPCCDAGHDAQRVCRALAATQGP